MSRYTALGLIRKENRGALLIALPFILFMALFLVYPITVVVIKAVAPHGTASPDALIRAVSGTYRTGFINSISLSATSAVIAAVLGTALALAIRSLQRPAWLRPTLDSWSAVASQLGGVPLAFAFIATIGTQGILTKILAGRGLSIGDYGISPTGFWGLVVVYLYFQIPLMFLVMMPAVAGLRVSWREAAEFMGASSFRYWRRVGIPILTPAILGGTLLLFVNAFTAYATAYVLNPSGSLVPLQIRFLLQGNVVTGEEDLGNAIVVWVIALLLASLTLMLVLQRRTLRWTSS